MGMLALATPADLTSVRKVGPIRAGVIRSHVLDELARFYPDARSDHSEEATARRRMERLRAIPVERLPLDAVTIEWLGRLGRTCADLAQRPRVECEPATGILVADPDLIVVALTRLLLPDRSHTRPTAATREDDAVQEAETRRVRAEMLRERDREWDEAAPPGYARPDPRSRGRP